MTSNETFIDELVKLTAESPNPFSKDFWIRCFAHIMNMFVQDILKSVSDLLQQLRHLVIAIRASPQRIQKFLKMLAYFNLTGFNYD